MYSIGGHINGSSNSWCYTPNDETGIDFCVRGSATEGCGIEDQQNNTSIDKPWGKTHKLKFELLINLKINWFLFEGHELLYKLK